MLNKIKKHNKGITALLAGGAIFASLVFLLGAVALLGVNLFPTHAVVLELFNEVWLPIFFIGPPLVGLIGATSVYRYLKEKQGGKLVRNNRKFSWPKGITRNHAVHGITVLLFAALLFMIAGLYSVIGNARAGSEMLLFWVATTLVLLALWVVYEATRSFDKN